MEHNSAIKRNEVMIPATKWMNLKNVKKASHKAHIYSHKYEKSRDKPLQTEADQWMPGVG